MYIQMVHVVFIEGRHEPSASPSEHDTRVMSSVYAELMNK